MAAPPSRGSAQSSTYGSTTMERGGGGSSSNNNAVPAEVRVATTTTTTTSETFPLLGSPASTATTTVIYDDVSTFDNHQDIENPGAASRKHAFAMKYNQNHHKSSNDSYATANDDQRDLLRFMDEVMKESKEEGIVVTIPSLTLNEMIHTGIEPPSCCSRFMSWICAIQVPLLALLMTVSIALGVVYILDQRLVLEDALPQSLFQDFYKPLMLFGIPGLTLVLGMLGA